MIVERRDIRTAPPSIEDARYTGTARPRGTTREVSILDVLVALGPHKRAIVFITVVAAIVGFGISWLVRPSYTARIVVLPPQQNNSLAATMMSELSGLGALGGLAGSSLGLKDQVDLYAQLFKTETIQDGLIKQFNLQHVYDKKYLSQTRKDLAKHTSIKTDLKSNLITITFTDHDAKRAAAVANAYVDQYRDLSQHLAISEASQRRAFFQRQMVQAKNDLANAEQALVATQQKTGMVSLDSQERALIASAAALRAQITVKEAEIQSMQAYATPENPQLIEAQRSLSSLQAQLTKMGVGGETIGSEFVVPQAKVPKAGMEYVRRLRDVKYYETIFNILARQYEAAKLDEAREGQLIQVVDPALVPD
ncbi:MAG TPA: Wzz/FepE/Etk N-terminal domain-containing protein, partial [Acidobacteriaceae bacterium]|nr:Wzz/FepE/Etk N-terminal domain-containing protein [Acidobacteriaceae bacterium]